MVRSSEPRKNKKQKTFQFSYNICKIMGYNHIYKERYGPLHFASCEAEATLKWTPGRHRMPKGFG